MDRRRARGRSVGSAATHPGKDWTRFAIKGHQFAAVPYAVWLRCRATAAGQGESREAGRVRLNGVEHVLLEGRDLEPWSPPSAPPATLLTGRELQIAYAVAAGRCDKVIAHDLGISAYTVREHMRRIFHKLKVCKRTALVTHLILLDQATTAPGKRRHNSSAID
jgi:ATP/maltotriose-dependent transcriptional regulator MalT